MILSDGCEELKRMEDVRLGKAEWRKWGPYLSERQWGTVREDYSPEGTAWEYLPHDHARSRAYRWGEDGIAGISDEKQQLCFALALWNGKDPILKERLFGLTGDEGNHGEDVKEYYFYLDNIPSHAYMKYLYKYSQNAFPYSDLVKVNKARSRYQFEYELLDTGIFDHDYYFDVFVEYAKTSPEEILIRFTIANRGSQQAGLDLLPNLWFRNTWSWDKTEKKPTIQLLKNAPNHILKASHQLLGDYYLYFENPSEVLFTENETNIKRLFNAPNSSPYVKDAFHEYIINSNQNAINQNNTGTKAAIRYKLSIPPQSSKTICLRLGKNGCLKDPFGKGFDQLLSERKNEADIFYQRVTPYNISDDMRNVQRQAFAGLLWNKQCYYFNVKKWLDGDPAQPPPSVSRKLGRDHQWPHLDVCDIFSMSDKWEYPWFAAWDLAFHTITFSMIDPEFAKCQLLLLTKEWIMAPDGQIPAYEWRFNDVNPPVQAWAAMRVYNIEKEMYGREDRSFLKKMFDKLLLNFNWWVSRKDTSGKNVFEGGFLGLDNIGAFDRSLSSPSGGFLEQPDATAWMGMYCLNCLQIALELAKDDPSYEDMAIKFFEHFVYIADAINNLTGNVEGLWDVKTGFYYGLLQMPGGRKIVLHEDNMTGFIPLFAVNVNESDILSKFQKYKSCCKSFLENHPAILNTIADIEKSGVENRILLAFANEKKLNRILSKVLDEGQFLSPYGIRSVSKRLARSPFVIDLGGREFVLDYEPAEATTNIFGGNSNWRGPIWFPLNFLIIESLQKFYHYYGNNLKVECPVGSGKMLNLWDVSHEISYKLIKIFLRDNNGRRPVFGGIEKFQKDPHWRDYILFHEYFHGDNGAGLGASNQTGWTSLVAKLIHQYGKFAVQQVSSKAIEEEKKSDT